MTQLPQSISRQLTSCLQYWNKASQQSVIAWNSDSQTCGSWLLQGWGSTIYDSLRDWGITPLSNSRQVHPKDSIKPFRIQLVIYSLYGCHFQQELVSLTVVQHRAKLAVGVLHVIENSSFYFCYGVSPDPRTLECVSLMGLKRGDQGHWKEPSIQLNRLG